MKKIIKLLLILSIFLFPLTTSEGSASTTEYDLKQEYSDIQRSFASEEDKIKNTIDTYFILKLECRKKGLVPEFEYLFDNNKKAKSIYEDEVGRLKYRIL